MKKQRMKHCFFALTLCCTAGSMYGQVAQDSSKTIGQVLNRSAKI